MIVSNSAQPAAHSSSPKKKSCFRSVNFTTAGFFFVADGNKQWGGVWEHQTCGWVGVLRCAAVLCRAASLSARARVFACWCLTFRLFCAILCLWLGGGWWSVVGCGSLCVGGVRRVRRVCVLAVVAFCVVGWLVVVRCALCVVCGSSWCVLGCAVVCVVAVVVGVAWCFCVSCWSVLAVVRVVRAVAWCVVVRVCVPFSWCVCVVLAVVASCVPSSCCAPSWSVVVLRLVVASCVVVRCCGVLVVFGCCVVASGVRRVVMSFVVLVCVVLCGAFFCVCVVWFVVLGVGASRALLSAFFFGWVVATLPPTTKKKCSPPKKKDGSSVRRRRRRQNI